MTDNEFTMDRTTSDGPPPWFREPATPHKARIVGVELTEHDKYGTGYRFLLHINDEPTGETVWYTTGRTFGRGENKLVKLVTALHGTWDAAPDDVRENVGLGLTVIFEQSKDAEGKWSEKIVSITPRKLTKAEEAEDVAKHELAAQAEPF